MHQRHPLYRHIACFIDQTDDAVIRSALAVAARLHVEGGRLSIVHVAPPMQVLQAGLSGWPLDADDPVRPVRDWLEQETAGIEDAERLVLTDADPPKRAVEWAAGAGVDLVVASRHSTRVQRAALGSFTDGLARHTHTSVLLVPPGYAGRLTEPGSDLAHILCCIDDSPAASAALSEAARLRDAAGLARLTALRVIVPPRPFRIGAVARHLPAPGSQERWVRGRLDAAAAGTSHAEAVVIKGLPRDACTWATENGADLIVVGAHGDRPGPRMPGAFAHTVGLHAAEPVLLVPPAPGAADAGAPGTGG